MYYAYKQKACVAVCVTKIYIREPNETAQCDSSYLFIYLLSNNTLLKTAEACD